MLMPNARGRGISMHFNARAFARTVASACASSTEAIVNAIEHLRTATPTSSSPAAPSPPSTRSPSPPFSAMQALSRRNDDPETASRPYDVDRDGFVMGEGAAALVLETEEHAQARGAKIYAEVVGGGVTADSYHITAHDPEGRGAARAIDAGARRRPAPRSTTSRTSTRTPRRPRSATSPSTRRCRRVFGDRVHEIPVSATKASTGHLLGGTGALEAIFTILALSDRVAPPTINIYARRTRPCRSTSSGSAAAARRRPAARDQQLVRLRRPQRRRRVPLHDG